MNRQWFQLFAAGLLLLAAGCATTAPAPAPALTGEDRYLVDPRIGAAPAPSPSTDRRFDAAWQAFQSGNAQVARRQFEQLRNRNAGWAPADLAIAAIDIREGRLDLAHAVVTALVRNSQAYTAAQVYDAELSVRENDLRHAATVYAQASALPGAPEIVRSRAIEIRRRLVDQLVSSARAGTPAQATPLLREALTWDPGSRSTRLLLVHQLLVQKNWDAARSTLDPLVASEPDRAEVQEALAEIDAGRGLYEQAIGRYERLARRDRDPRYTERLDQLKQLWSAANMPPQFLRALEADAITRADLAVLIFWKVSSVRFAQNLPAPPIAVDIDEVAGREELVRAIAIGMLQVDPVTRNVNPATAVGAAQLTRYTARVLTSRGASCARGAGADASRVLAACHVTDLSATLPPDSPVTGHQAAGVVAQVDAALSAR